MTATGRVETRREKEDSSTPSTGVPGPDRAEAGRRWRAAEARDRARVSSIDSHYHTNNINRVMRPTPTDRRRRTARDVLNTAVENTAGLQITVLYTLPSLQYAILRPGKTWLSGY